MLDYYDDKGSSSKKVENYLGRQTEMKRPGPSISTHHALPRLSASLYHEP